MHVAAIVPNGSVAADDLGHPEQGILHTLCRQLQGDPCPPCFLTPAEYAAAVLALQARGLCGADLRTVWDDPDAGPVRLVDRVWLTAEGREHATAAGPVA